MAKAGKTGVSTKTPKNIVFGAGTIHKNLEYSGSAWNLEDSIIGATNGGSTLTITPEITTIEADGALVAVKGMKVRTGEVARLKLALLELSKESLIDATLGAEGVSADTTYDLIVPQADITEGNYVDNIAFVGKTVEGKNCIAILHNALCINGLELGTENKASAVAELEYECHAELDSDLDVLPWEIYYPKAA